MDPERLRSAPFFSRQAIGKNEDTAPEAPFAPAAQIWPLCRVARHNGPFSGRRVKDFPPIAEMNGKGIGADFGHWKGVGICVWREIYRFIRAMRNGANPSFGSGKHPMEGPAVAFPIPSLERRGQCNKIYINQESIPIPSQIENWASNGLFFNGPFGFRKAMGETAGTATGVLKIGFIFSGILKFFPAPQWPGRCPAQWPAQWKVERPNGRLKYGETIIIN